MKKRILHIAQAAGGVERYLHTLLHNIDRQRFENILVCSQDYSVEAFEDVTEKIEVLPMHRDINALDEMKTVVRLRKIIRKYSPDIVYLHSSKAGAVGRIADIGLKNYCIYNAHGWAFNMRCGRKKQIAYQLIEKVLSVFCDRIVAISEYEKRSAVEKKICSADKIRVIYNGVTEKAPDTASELPAAIPEDAYVIGFVGRISKQKAPDVFIRAAALIRKKISNAYFVIVGDGEDREKLEKLIKDLHLEKNVYITGWVDDPNVYIRRFDLAMLLSRWEGFGLVLPEYMLCRKPIVATKADAIPELVRNDVNGYLVDIDDYKAAAKAAVRIYESPETAAALADNGYNIAKTEFTAERFVEEHEKMFEEAGK